MGSPEAFFFWLWMVQTAPAPHAAQRRPNILDRGTRSIPALKPAHRTHTAATAAFSCLSASCLSTPGAHGAKWVRATPANAPGGRLRQARRSACPTQGWVKRSLKLQSPVPYLYERYTCVTFPSRVFLCGRPLRYFCRQLLTVPLGVV